MTDNAKPNFIIKHSRVIVHMVYDHFGFMVDINNDPVNWFYATVIHRPTDPGDEWILKHDVTGYTVYVNPQSNAYIGMVLIPPNEETNDNQS